MIKKSKSIKKKRLYKKKLRENKKKLRENKKKYIKSYLEYKNICKLVKNCKSFKSSSSIEELYLYLFEANENLDNLMKCKDLRLKHAAEYFGKLDQTHLYEIDLMTTFIDNCIYSISYIEDLIKNKGEKILESIRLVKELDEKMKIKMKNIKCTDLYNEYKQICKFL